MYYWLFDSEETTPILKVDFDNYTIFHRGESLASEKIESISVYFDVESFDSEPIIGEYFITDYFPIVSQRFINLLKDNDITNYELFNVKLLAKDGSQPQKKFYILNVIGNCRLDSMSVKDSKCNYDIFRNPQSSEYITITEDFLTMLKESRGDEPWYVYTSVKFDFEWFRENHLNDLRDIYGELSKIYESSQPGEAFTQKMVKEFLAVVERLVPYDEFLPAGGGGLPQLETALAKSDEFRERFLNKPEDEASYWFAQDIESEVFTIVNYMEAICLDE